MDNHEENQTPETGQALIDIFYKDTYRLESLISQIDNGALQTVTTIMDSKQGSVSSYNGSIGAPAIIGASAKHDTSESIEEHIQKTKKSFDDTIIDLLSKLGISPQTKDFSKTFSTLNIITGRITLRNYNTFSQIIPLLKNGNALFDKDISTKTIIKRHIDILKNKSSKSKEDKLQIAALEKQYCELQIKVLQNELLYENLQILLPFLPSGLGFTITTDDGTSFSGSIKNDYLIDSEEDIFMNQGSNLPDKWNMLGIVDSKEAIPASSTNDAMANLTAAMTDSLKSFFPTDADATIIPLLIYRELNICS